MPLTVMYPGMSNSPKTLLSDDVAANDSIIKVEDATKLPAAPNLAVIGSTEQAEVIVYSGKDGNVLTGVLRGQGGTTARSWLAETVVARNFTLIDYSTLCANIEYLDTYKRGTSDAIDIGSSNNVTGELPVENGGTGTNSANGIKTLLGLGALAYKAQAALASDVSGTLPVANGGTGLSESPSMLTNLASTTAANILDASPRPGVTGTLPIANGGTGATTAAAARNALGLGDTVGALPIANGGTGETTAAAARNALGLGNTAGALPIANGGTGATTAAAARNALGLGDTTIATRPNYTISNSNLTPGSSTLASGTIYFYV